MTIIEIHYQLSEINELQLSCTEATRKSIITLNIVNVYYFHEDPLHSCSIHLLIK